MTTIKDFYTNSDNNEKEKKQIEVENKSKAEEKVEIKEEKKEKIKVANKKSFSTLKLKLLFKKLGFYLSYLKPEKLRYYLSYYYEEYKRIILLSRKPDTKEFKELSLVVLISALMAGVLGLIIELAFYFI